VKINFLVVGHTHEDIDQYFSKISAALGKSGCESLPGLYLQYRMKSNFSIIQCLDLMCSIQNSCKAKPDCELLDGIWDYKEWMKPFLGKIENHSKYHVFRFTKKQAKVCIMLTLVLCL